MIIVEEKHFHVRVPCAAPYTKAAFMSSRKVRIISQSKLPLGWTGIKTVYLVPFSGLILKMLDTGFQPLATGIKID